MKKWMAWVMVSALLLAFSGAMAETSDQDVLVSAPLPVDFTGGFEGLSEGYTKDRIYEDPTIRVEITEKDVSSYIAKYKGRTAICWVADVRIGDASQLRTAPAVSFETNNAAPAEKIAERVNAILAFNGDFTSRLNDGILLRQGVTYRNRLKGQRDVLMIDEDGDFHIAHLAKDGDAGETVDGKRVLNAFYFGPALVENGEIANPLPSFRFLKPEKFYSRVAICQLGPLHYKVLVTTTEQGRTMGLKLEDFARLCRDEGAVTAYNLDGGLSATMYFNHQRLNGQNKVNFRDIPDIVYFASAWNGGAGE